MSKPPDEMATHAVLAVKATDRTADVEKEKAADRLKKKKRARADCDGGNGAPVSPTSSPRESMRVSIQRQSRVRPEDKEWTESEDQDEQEPRCSAAVASHQKDDADNKKEARTKEYNKCTRPNDSNSGPQQFVGRRFAKYFPPHSGLFYGTVDAYRYEKDDDEGDNEDGFLWHVSYTDGDEEEYNRQELLEGLDLCEQSTARPPLSLHPVGEETDKSLWELYSLTTTNTPSSPSSSSPSLDKKPRGNLLHNNKKKPKIDPHHPHVLRIQQNQKLPAIVRNNALSVLMFFYFIKERQDMWKRYQDNKQSENGNGHNAPWTTQDGILRNHNFCNIYRELDRGTQFFHAQMLLRWDAFCNNKKETTDKKMKVDDPSPPSLLVEWILEVLWAAYVYRLCNKLESFLPAATATTTGTKPAKKASETFTFHRIPTLDEWPQFKKFVQQAQKRMGNRQKFFTGAHQNNGFHNYLQGLATLAARQGQLVRQTADSIFHDAVQKRDLQACVQHVKNLYGCGDFMAWQITCDLMESNALPGCHFNDFCQLGPGAKAGLWEIFTKATSQPTMTELELCQQLVQVQDQIYPRSMTFPKWRNRCLTLKEIEHALCEFSKYRRVERGQRAKLRNRSSRSFLDQASPCFACSATTRLMFCDTCNNPYCPKHNCQSDDGCHDYARICKRCLALKTFQWES